MKNLSGKEYRNEFRISKETFEFVCQLLEGNYKIKNPNYPLDERVAIALWRLANGAKMIEGMRKFGLPPQTFQKYCLEVYQAIEDVLKENYLEWPETEDRARIKNEFQEASGIPNIVGTLYTTYLRLNPKKKDKRYDQLINKRFGCDLHTLPVQGLVDSKGIFIDVYCHHEVGGMKTDEEVLWMSNISMKIGLGEIIAGGQRYPLQDWLMVPYPRSNLTSEEYLMFNGRILKVQQIVREAFEELVGRWSFLKKEIEVDLTNIPTIVRVCCILHNICKVRKDELHVKFSTNIGNCATPVVGNPPPSAISARDSIAKSLVESWADNLFVS